MLKSKFCLWGLLLAINPIWAQNQRIRVDFSLKEKQDTLKKLIIGTIFYDSSFKKIVYSIHYPDTFTWVETDTNIYTFKEEILIDRRHSVNLIKLSLYHQALLLNLRTINLNLIGFSAKEVTKEDGMIITSWRPSRAPKEQEICIKTSAKEGHLFGWALLRNDSVLSRQFFRKYIKVSNISFPQENISYIHFGKQTITRIFTYSNIIINEQKNENIYNYPIPY
jgi:hypothetical protein